MWAGVGRCIWLLTLKSTFKSHFVFGFGGRRERTLSRVGGSKNCNVVIDLYLYTPHLQAREPPQTHLITGYGLQRTDRFFPSSFSSFLSSSSHASRHINPGAPLLCSVHVGGWQRGKGISILVACPYPSFFHLSPPGFSFVFLRFRLPPFPFSSPPASLCTPFPSSHHAFG